MHAKHSDVTLGASVLTRRLPRFPQAIIPRPCRSGRSSPRFIRCECDGIDRSGMNKGFTVAVIPENGIGKVATHSRAPWVCFALLGGLCCCRAHAGAPSRADHGVLAWAHCPHCALEVGTGTTFLASHWTGGIVLPVFLEIDGSRWELGAYRFLTRQYLKSSLFPPGTVGAPPFWAFTAMHRWQILHRSRWKLYVGLGAAYQTRTDRLDATQWNFAYVLALRYSAGRHVFLEFSARHWSNAWIKLPDRGQSQIMMSIGLR